MFISFQVLSFFETVDDKSYMEYGMATFQRNFTLMVDYDHQISMVKIILHAIKLYNECGFGGFTKNIANQILIQMCRALDQASSTEYLKLVLPCFESMCRFFEPSQIKSIIQV